MNSSKVSSFKSLSQSQLDISLTEAQEMSLTRLIVSRQVVITVVITSIRCQAVDAINIARIDPISTPPRSAAVEHHTPAAGEPRTHHVAASARTQTVRSIAGGTECRPPLPYMCAWVV
jgi:hypothetical protein